MVKRIAVVGGGIAGLSAAYLLNKKYEVTLFEKNNRLGGNAYTYKTRSGDTVDIGVTNLVTPPSKNFLKLCNELKVKVMRHTSSGMFSIHDSETGDSLYMTPFSLKGLMIQRFALFRSMPSIIKALNILNNAEKQMEKGELRDVPMGQVFKELTRFEQNLIFGFFCFLSAMFYDDVINAPAEYFLDVFKAYGRLNTKIYCPVNFTGSYVNALAEPYRDRIMLNSKIISVARDNEIKIKTAGGKERIFDAIVFACNADHALALLEKPTDEEKRLLGSWKFTDIPAVVHRDDSGFPAKELCQGWTIVRSTKNGSPHFSSSSCSWLVSPSASKKDKYFSTNHPNSHINKDLIELETNFRMPIYDVNSFSTMKDLPSLNGKMNTYYCGGYFGHGMHGETVNSAIAAVKHLGIEW